MISEAKQKLVEGTKTRYRRTLAFKGQYTDGTSSYTGRFGQKQQVRTAGLASAKGSVGYPPKLKRTAQVVQGLETVD